MKNISLKPLIIFEMANNHMGNVAHAIRIIKELAKVSKNYDFTFAVKLQYRQLDTFLHPDYKERMDLKFVKRFSETRLTEKDFIKIHKALKANSFLAICTPFDEESVDLIEKHKYDYIKIGSCSFTDWPLLERIGKSKLPLIASTAGYSLEEIDRVVSFFENKRRNLTLMHCVGEYPTPDDALQLGQIDVLRKRYPHLRIGYSTHENPDNSQIIKLAYAKGARVFEKHIGLPTAKYDLNQYSASPNQVKAWLDSLNTAVMWCGVDGERVTTKKEVETLRDLKRGVFARRDIATGESITEKDIFKAMPSRQGQVLANDLSRFAELRANKDLKKHDPIGYASVEMNNARDQIHDIAKRVKNIIRESGVVVPQQTTLEISHHYGLETFNRYGCVLINYINRSYCKKVLVVMPGQENPEHAHKKKEETFHVLHGDLWISLNGKKKKYGPGDIVLVKRGAKHSFGSKNGAVFEEISSTHYKSDSFYTDKQIMRNTNRKSKIKLVLSPDLA